MLSKSKRDFLIERYGLETVLSIEKTVDEAEVKVSTEGLFFTGTIEVNTTKFWTCTTCLGVKNTGDVCDYCGSEQGGLYG